MSMCKGDERHSYIKAFAVGLFVLSMGIAGPVRSSEIGRMSLEELLDLQLSSMAISGIHHTHEAGEWMVGYRLMHMGMKGNRSGTSRESGDDVIAQGFMATPLSMDMEMHMFGLMYAPTDKLTLMFMVPYIRKSMDHINMGGLKFTTRTRGIGDLKLSGLYSLYESSSHRVIGKLGLSLPTGSIDEVDDIPMPGVGFVNVRLPYPMQLGSGTFGLLPGLTYLGQVAGWSWGADVSGNLRLGENKYDYRLGHEYELTSWGARRFNDWSSGSLRLLWKGWGNINGADPSLNPGMVPTADPELRAGRRLDFLIGINVFESEGDFAGNRIAIEVGVPVYQWLDGPQLETDWTTSLEWQWTF